MGGGDYAEGLAGCVVVFCFLPEGDGGRRHGGR